MGISTQQRRRSMWAATVAVVALSLGQARAEGAIVGPAAGTRAVEVLAFQRSGSNLLRMIQKLTFNTSGYNAHAHPGTAANRYCLKCMNCTIRDLGGFVRNAPGQTHFRLDKPFFKPKPPYTKCRFPTMQLSVHSLPDLVGLYGAPMTFLVAVKEPVFWLVSILRFWGLKCPDVTDERCMHLLRDWVSYYERWLELTANRTSAEVGGSAVSIVRYEDVLHDAAGLLERLGAQYGWVRRPNATVVDMDSLEVPYSRRSAFHKKRSESEHRTFLLRPRHPDHPGDKLAWYRLNCPALRAFFATTDVPQRLGYDLWYLRECDPPGVTKRWRAFLDARQWLLAATAAVAVAVSGWWAARRRREAERAGVYAPLPAASEGAALGSPGSRRWS